MLSINTNLSSLITQESLKSSTKLLNQAVERMTTGYKINGAKDNAANFNISTNMTTKIGAYQVAEDNCVMGLDLLETATGNLDLISDKLLRLRALAEQASNGTYGNQSLQAINHEANALVDEIERIYSTAEYNGRKLLEVENVSGMPKAGADGFIVYVEKKDTSSLDKLSSVEDDVALTTGTYCISKASELKQLAIMTNKGLIGADCVFVLADDINLSEYENWTAIGTSANKFNATFDGNGYKITNLKISKPAENIQGLFGDARNSVIKNLGVVGANVEGNAAVGVLVGVGGVVENCYTTGKILAHGYSIGGVVGQLSNLINNCYSDVDVTSDLNDNKLSASAGLVGTVQANARIIKCYATGDIKANIGAGGLIGNIYTKVTIENCYASGNVEGGQCSGGLGSAILTNAVANINNCYASGNVEGNFNIGGFIGVLYGNTNVEMSNCYTKGIVEGDDNVGGFIGGVQEGSNTKIKSCYTTSYINRGSGFIGYFMGTQVAINFDDCYMLGTLDSNASSIYAVANTASKSKITVNNCYYNPDGVGSLDKFFKFTDDSSDVDFRGEFSVSGLTAPFSFESSNGNKTTLQIGIDSGESSSITFEIGLQLEYLNSMRSIGNNGSNSLTRIDYMLAELNNSSTEFGAVQNRLESVLDEIMIQYDNLVSSRSTLRDADIAEVSSTYIQQQILQQASATLLATANQSPSIALQLI